jgi:hypothetical protein
MSEATTMHYDWAKEPFVLEIADVARILRRSVSTIRRGLRHGSMVPAPMPKAGKTTPYQWARADVQAWLEGGYRKHDAVGARRLRPAPRRGRAA